MAAVAALLVVLAALSPEHAGAHTLRGHHRHHARSISLIEMQSRTFTKRQRMEVRREATRFESEVSAMDTTVRVVAARLKEATELLHAVAQAPKTEKAKDHPKATKPAEKTKETTKVSAPAKEVAKNSTGVAAASAEKKPVVHVVDPDKQAKVDALLKKHDKKAAMMAEKDILEGLFAHLKSSIKGLNTQEKKDKTENSAELKKIQARLLHDQARLKDPKAHLSAFEHAELVNRTRIEEHEVQYWSHGRELQHGMFHANLKLTHGLMQRVKSVMEAYQQAIQKGHVDPKMVKSLDAISLPKAFLQMRVALRKLAKTHRKRLLHETQLLY